MCAYESCEFSSVGRDIAFICRGLEFELRSFHLSTLRVKFITTRLLEKKLCSYDTY
jgi:hypothetical protein